MAARKITTPKQRLAKTADTEILAMLGGDVPLFNFYKALLVHDMNATKAYMAINPKVTYASAGVMAHQWLKKIKNIDPELVYSQYNLNIHRYLNKIDQGLEAKRVTEGGRETRDWNTQMHFHTKLGNLLGFDSQLGKPQNNNVNIQVNNYEKVEIAPVEPVVIQEQPDEPTANT